MKFPLFIDIENKPVLVVGAGSVGCRRINTLIAFKANITAVDNKIHNESLRDKITFIERYFKESDIENKLFVIASTDNRALNHRIYELCRAKNIPVSVADSSEESSFFFPAVCMNEKLCVGIVSDGDNHSLVRETAKEIRNNIL